MNKNIIKLDVDNNKGGEYKLKTIYNNAVYIRKLELDYLLGLYYLVF